MYIFLLTQSYLFINQLYINIFLSLESVEYLQLNKKTHSQQNNMIQALLNVNTVFERIIYMRMYQPSLNIRATLYIVEDRYR